jgi:hypothetical protein
MEKLSVVLLKSEVFDGVVVGVRVVALVGVAVGVAVGVGVIFLVGVGVVFEVDELAEVGVRLTGASMMSVGMSSIFGVMETVVTGDEGLDLIWKKKKMPIVDKISRMAAKIK